jgi:O-antigen/teichoic acid export membrane protein
VDAARRDPHVGAMTTRLAVARRWGGRAFWSIADQGLFAGTNFLVMVLLARWMEPAAYGALATAYAAFLLLGTLHTALWTEPMLVFGGGRYRDSFRSYVRVLLRAHWIASVGLAGLAAAAALVLDALAQPDLASAAWGLTVAAPLTLFMWFARRVPYVHMRPAQAVEGGVLYLVVLLPAVYLLVRHGHHAAGEVLAAMGLAALLAGLCILFRASRAAPQDRVENGIGAVTANHWEYGRWAILAGALSWVPSSSPFLILPIYGGLEASAEYRAALNILMPVFQTNSAISSILLPSIVSMREREKKFKIIIYSTLFLSIMAITYCVIAISLRSVISEHIYGGNYNLDFGIMSILSGVTLTQGIALVFGASLRAMGLPKLLAANYAIAALVTLGCAFPLIKFFGAFGAAMALAAGSVVLAITTYIAWYQRRLLDG